MGTKIQCKTYLPGFCSRSDLNNNCTNPTWLVNGENKSRKDIQNVDSVLFPQSVDGYSEYDKETVRQTILKHETIFRHQLQELHRLYRRQRDLMNEHQRNEVLNHGKNPLQSTPSLPHLPSPDMKKTWQVSHFPSLDSIAGQLSMADAARNQSSFNFIENNSQSCHFSSQVTISSKERGLFNREMFDSRVVIDGCTDSEEHPTRKQWQLPFIHGNPVGGISQIPQSRDAKTPVASPLKFHSGADPHRSNSSKRTKELADLNKPLPLEEALPLAPDINSGSITWPEGGHYDGGRSYSNSFKGRIGEICLHRTPCWNGEDKLTYEIKAEQKQSDIGFSGRHETAEKSPDVFQSSQGCEHFKHPPLKETNTEYCRRKTIFGVEISEDKQVQSASSSNVCISTHKSQPITRSYTELLQDVEANRGNIHMSHGGRSHSIPEDVISYQNADSKRLLIANDVQDRSLVGCDTASGMTPSNSEHCYPKHDWMRTCSVANDMDVKSAGLKDDKGICCVSLTEAAGKTAVSGDCQRKPGSSRMVLPWLVVKSHEKVEQTKGMENCCHLNLNSLQNYSQQFFRREDTAMESSQILSQRQGTLSSRSNKDSECQKSEVSETAKIRTIFGVPIFSASKESHAAGAPSKANFPDIDSGTAKIISEEKTVSRSQEETKDCISGLRHQIDLNLSLDEEEAPLAPPFPQAVVRIATTEIDLEAPAVLESEAECKNSTLEEFNKSNEEAIRLAAESIISISLSGANEEVNDVLRNEPLDCLKWFAELVSSHCSDQEFNTEEILSSTECKFDEESVPDGFDYFEFMTLRLKDMNEAEYYKMPTLENHNDEEAGASISKRPRRGQARRGRQRKDFQRDVLPGIISLSRYEVNKDIVTFEELFKANGCSWQSSFSHKKTGKSRRGRKRLGNDDPSPTSPADLTPPVNHLCSTELVVEEKSLTGWGKRTRRLPRQRCLNGSLNLSSNQF